MEAPTGERDQYRKHPVHGVRIQTGSPTIVFLTVCTRGRSPWLAENAVHDLLRSVWREADAWLAGRYVIMPDHVHLFAGLGPVEFPFDNWVRYWKSQFTRQHRVAGHRWETDHWDTRMRNAARYAEKWEYVRENPVRHGLVRNADDWPFQGEIHRLTWQPEE